MSIADVPLQSSTDTAAQAGVHRTTPAQMKEVIERHLAAEAAGDVAAAVAVYTPDVVHDVVGAPTGPLHGPEQASAFYDMLTTNLDTIDVQVNHEYFGDDVCVVEHQWTGTVPGQFLGIPGLGKQVSFRMLHVFEFRAGLISRENVWLDGGAIAAQLTA